MTTIGHSSIAQDPLHPHAASAPASAEAARREVQAFGSRLAAHLHAVAGQRAANQGPVREVGVEARARREQAERDERGSALRSMPAAIAAVELRSPGVPGPVQERTDQAMTASRRGQANVGERAFTQNAAAQPTTEATIERAIRGSKVGSSVEPASHAAMHHGAAASFRAEAKGSTRVTPVGNPANAAGATRAAAAAASGSSAASTSGGGSGRAGATAGDARAVLDRLSRFQASRPRLTAQTESQLVAQAQRALAAVLKTGEGTAMIRLRPDGLGELRITLEVRGQSVDATIEARSVEARAALERRSHELRESLEARGLIVDRLTVTLLPERAAAEQAGAWAMAQERRGGEGPRKDGHRRGAAIAPEAVEAAGTGNALESAGASTRSVGAMDRPRSGPAAWGGAQLEHIRLDAIA